MLVKYYTIRVPVVFKKSITGQIQWSNCPVFKNQSMYFLCDRFIYNLTFFLFFWKKFSYLQFTGRIFVVIGVMLHSSFNKKINQTLFIYILKLTKKLQGKLIETQLWTITLKLIKVYILNMDPA